MLFVQMHLEVAMHFPRGARRLSQEQSLFLGLMDFNVQVRIAARRLRVVTEKSTSCRSSNLCE